MTVSSMAVGGLRATFFASYLHTCITFAVLLVFVSSVYTSGSWSAAETGSAGQVLTSLLKTSFNFRRAGGARCSRGTKEMSAQAAS